MSNVISRKIIKANIIGDNSPINANIVQNGNQIKSTLTTYQSATTEHKGIIRIATDEEAIEGISNNTAITPHTLRLVTHYTFEQGIASDTWIIYHNLNKKPSITIVDSSGKVQLPNEIEYTDENTITVTFLGAFAGKAFLN